MIRVLGIKRIILLTVLVAINAALGAAVYLHIVPEADNKNIELATLRSQNSTTQADITRLQVEFDQLDAQREEFEELRRKGFIGTQDRRQAEKLFVKIGEEAGVFNSVASVQRGTIEDNAEAEKAGHKVLKSPILVQIKALDDVDVFRYIYLVEQFFPGHIAIDSVDIRRSTEVSGTVLRAIAGGKNLDLVTADMVIVWRTLIPESEVIGEGENL